MATKYTKQKDGSFATRVWDGSYNDDNSKHYIKVRSTKSSADLERKVAKIVKARDEGNLTITSDILFSDYAREWLTAYKAVRERGTQIMYENIINKHLAPLNQVKLSDIRRIHFQLVINTAMDSPRICQQINITFRQVIKSAIADNLLITTAFDSICTGIELPKYKPSEKRALTAVEKQAIKSADFTDREKAFVLIAYGCGLRRGEILALTVFDISLKRAELTVNKALAYDGNNPYIKDPKSISGARTVPMPGFLSDYMSNYLTSLSGSHLFTKRGGDMMTKSSYDKMWASIVRKLNTAAGGSDLIQVVDGLTAHVFRHNYCANLCYQIPVISIDTIASLLGDTKKMVLEVYSHVLEEKEDVQTAVSMAVAL